MISEEIYNCNVIDLLIKQNRSFAIYRIPGETVPRFVMQTSGTVRLFSTVEELNGQSGFVIAPFQVTPTCPIVLIRSDQEELPPGLTDDMWETNFSGNLNSNAYNQLQSVYSDSFQTFIKPLKNKELEKLVLSRCLTVSRNSIFSAVEAFFRASKRYIRSYVYLCHTPQTGTWLGCTPEIILSGEKNQWCTVALAGTQPLIQGELPSSWDDKNREEQRLVASYIQNQLHSLRIDFVEEGPYTVRAGELAHLKSDFWFSLPDNNKLGELLQLLHPTPAVCGLPKEEAYHFILNNEGYDRRYYSGFIGQLNPKGKTDLYVNLRCMNIQPQALTLYAGGGLLASSSAEDEWRETEDKLQTIRAVL